MRTLVPIGLVLAIAGCSSEKKPDPLAEAARACAHDPEMSCAVPILNVHSLRDAQRYYRESLGFKLDWEAGEPPDFGSVSRGHGTIFMCQGCQGNPGTWVMLFVPDVDGLHKELVRRRARIRMPPTNMPWGLREMHVSDPDGNVLRFGSSIEH